MWIEITRQDYSKKQTLGLLKVYAGDFDDINDVHVFECKTLELPWKNNTQQISCIPEGVYDVIRSFSPKFGKCFRFKDVPGRYNVLVHSGNYYTDILGCILVGAEFKDINNDGEKDVIYSAKTMITLFDKMPNEFKIKIL